VLFACCTTTMMISRRDFDQKQTNNTRQQD